MTHGSAPAWGHLLILGLEAAGEKRHFRPWKSCHATRTAHPVNFLTNRYGEHLSHPGPEMASQRQARASVKLFTCPKLNAWVRITSLAEVTSLGRDVKGFSFIIIASPVAQQILHFHCRFVIFLKALRGICLFSVLKQMMAKACLHLRKVLSHHRSQEHIYVQPVLCLPL